MAAAAVGPDSVRATIAARLKLAAGGGEGAGGKSQIADDLVVAIMRSCDPEEPQNRLARQKFLVDTSKLEAARLQVASTDIQRRIRVTK